MLKEYATAETFRRATVDQLRSILDVLAMVAWPCPVDQVPSIIQQLGWVFIQNKIDIDADTCLPLNRTLGEFTYSRDQFVLLGFPASDRVSKTDSVALRIVREAFHSMVRDIESILGQSSREAEDENLCAVWDLHSGGRIRLESIEIGLQVRLLSRDLADAERFEETHDMSEFYDDEDE